MGSSGYVLALDVGERRIGVAIASLIARLPAPLTYIDRQDTDAFETIKKLAAEQNAGVIVVGLPRGLNGQETAQTVLSRAFAKDLGEIIDLPIILQDEAGTSHEAEAILKAYNKPYGKGDIDAQSAVLILRDYLATETERSA